MISHLRASSKTLIVIVTSVATLILVMLPLVVGQAQPAASTSPMKVTTSTDAALNKLHPDLREVVQTDRDEILFVRIDAAEDIDLAPYTLRSITRPFAPLSETTTFAQMRAGNLTKLAALSGVTRVQPALPETTRQPPRARDPVAMKSRLSLEERRARLKRLQAIDIPWSETPALTRAGEKPAAWFDVRKGHMTKRAWAKGYRGQGVKVANIDGGTDLAHPDLIGTWAVVQEPSSPHYGWPMAFDPYSMLLYAFDQNFEANYVATGTGFYVDTSATPTVFRTSEDPQRGTARMNFAPFAHSEGRGGKRPGTAHEYVFKDTSRSGVYHIGNLPDRYLSEIYGEHVAVLVVDENAAGTYDTVYVDLDNDYDFTDEKPVTRRSPAAYRDMNGDGVTDLSGGVVYFIADGQTQIPGTDWFWGAQAPPPLNGSLVAFMGDFDPESGSHGTLTASNIVAQGQINGMAPQFQDLSGNGRPEGVVIGSAPAAKLVAVGNIYTLDSAATDAWLLCLLGYDGAAGTDDDIQIISNGFGSSEIDDDGWDYESRYIDRWVRNLNPTVSFLFPTINGAPGYGTVVPPSPSVGIKVGASTQFGSTGWDSITSTDQIVWGDVMGWSNRGPGARGTAGVDIVAEGAFGAGDIAINLALDGNLAWRSWGGTNRSAPVAAGNLALVYQAFKGRHDRWPSYEEARAALKSGASQTGFDVFTQGAGRLNADTATDIAGGRHGVMAVPSEWRVGDYRGAEYPAFANIIHPGASDTQPLTFHNGSNHDIELNLSAEALRRIDATRTFTATSRMVDQESPHNFFAPDYLIPIENIPENADLMIVSLTYPFDQFDPNGDYAQDQQWYLYLYDWTDVNGDSNLWEDLDDDGIVDHADKEPPVPANIDGFAALDWTQSEIDRYEYVRVMYASASANNQQVLMGNPVQRMHDGLFIGLQHPERSEDISTTDFQFQIDFYAYENWDWVSFANNAIIVPANSEATTNITLTVPANTAYGAYQGMILAEYAGRAPFSVRLPLITRGTTIVTIPLSDHTQPASQVSPAAAQYPPRHIAIPVVASVAAAYDGTGVLNFGGPAANDPDMTYNSGVVHGTFDWSWRAESGDWRFFFLDMLQTPPAGTQFITRNTWEDDSPPADIDTLIYGPARDRFADPNHPDNRDQNWAEPEYYGPYTLDLVGGSPNQHLGSGKWRFDTATGGAVEWIAGTTQEGLHLLMLHNVLFSGQQMNAPFETTLGTMTVQPPALSFTPAVTNTQAITASQCATLTFSSSLALPGLAAEGFGLSMPEELPDQIARQDDPNNPATASYKHGLTIDHASSLTVRTTEPGAGASDVDLYLVYDANGDGEFTFPDELIGSGVTPEAVESVSVRNPADGDYQIWVHGWNVAGESTFTLVIDAVEGFDITVGGVPKGLLPADTPVDLQVCYAKEISAGDSFAGEILLGPTATPRVISVPVDVTASTAAGTAQPAGHAHDTRTSWRKLH